MSPADYRLIAAAVAGIALSIILIIKGRLHPFVGLLCGAFAVGLLAGLPMEETAKAVEKGAGTILGGTGLVVALGLGLGAMLQLSNGAGGIATAALRMPAPSAASAEKQKGSSSAPSATPNWPKTAPAHRENGRQKSIGRGFSSIPARLPMSPPCRRPNGRAYETPASPPV